MILMKNLILILIFAAVGLNTMASNPVHVIITAGQSNTDGRTPNEDLPAYIKALATDTLTYAEGAYRYCQIAQNDGKEKIIKNATFLAMTSEKCETFLKKVIFLLQICLAAHIIGRS